MLHFDLYNIGTYNIITHSNETKFKLNEKISCQETGNDEKLYSYSYTYRSNFIYESFVHNLYCTAGRTSTVKYLSQSVNFFR